MNQNYEIKFYIKASIFFIGLFAFLTMLCIAKNILIPIVFSIIIAVILYPAVDFFVRFRINRVISIIITLFFTFFIIAALNALLYSQAIQFSEAWPILVDKITLFLNQSIDWISGYFSINPQKIQIWITTTKNEFINVNTLAIGHILISVGSGIMGLILIPVYVFMILYYQPHLLDFIHKLFSKSNQNQVSAIIIQIKTVIQSYLIGLIIETVIMAILNSVALLILGIEYAILLGIIGALLNIVPYIGGFVAVILAMMVALITKSTAWYAFYVLIIYSVIQLIDNNYIKPKIVASKVKINALFSIIVVIVGNAFWGISGMFLAIPILAIVKIIFDNVESLKSWGFLLGDTMPPALKIKSFWFKKSGKK